MFLFWFSTESATSETPREIKTHIWVTEENGIIKMIVVISCFHYLGGLCVPSICMSLSLAWMQEISSQFIVELIRFLNRNKQGYNKAMCRKKVLCKVYILFGGHFMGKPGLLVEASLSIQSKFPRITLNIAILHSWVWDFVISWMWSFTYSSKTA